MAVNLKYLRWSQLIEKVYFAKVEDCTCDTASGSPDDVCARWSGHSLVLYILGRYENQYI